MAIDIDKFMQKIDKKRGKYFDFYRTKLTNWLFYERNAGRKYKYEEEGKGIFIFALEYFYIHISELDYKYKFILHGTNPIIELPSEATDDECIEIILCYESKLEKEWTERMARIEELDKPFQRF